MPEIGSYHDCNICGQKFFVEHLYSQACGVCCGCADAVANTYNMAHGGQWLTWQNEVSHAPRKQSISQAVRWSVFRDDEFACKICGETEKPLHVDHIIPVARGGSNDRHNLQTLCETCNTSKGAR
jgi:5-methylcytosine-specific restriction enzyme A